jgi:hypothetical protein
MAKEHKHIFIRQVNSLTPADECAREALTGIPIGSQVSVEVSRPRNIQHHRKYWALCSAIAKSIGAQPENVSDVLKLRSGHFVVVQTLKERIQLPRSIAFHKMDQAAFNKFFEECAQVICSEFLPHLKPSDLTGQIEQMLGIAA